MVVFQPRVTGESALFGFLILPRSVASPIVAATTPRIPFPSAAGNVFMSFRLLTGQNTGELPFGWAGDQWLFLVPVKGGR